MTDEELTDKLNSRNALIVHFSHHANMREGGIFPQDMLDAIANRKRWPLSCCVIWPGHSMKLPGSVGIIFKPSVPSILSVSNDDSGSTTAVDGTELSNGSLLTHQTLTETFEVIGEYNEWRVIGAEVEGVFVQNPSAVQVKKEVNLPVGSEVVTTIAAEMISMDDVFAAFPGYKIFTMSTTAIVQISKP